MQLPRTAAIIFKLSRYLNIFITRRTRKDLSTRRDRTDLQRQQKQPPSDTSRPPIRATSPHNLQHETTAQTTPPPLNP